MQCTNCGAELQPGATVCPSCESRVVLNKQAVATLRKRAAAPSAKPAARSAAEGAVKAPKPPKAPKVRDESEPPAWVKPVVVVVAVLAVAAVAWFLYSILNAGPNTPDGAAVRFMQAYATYDAQGMLDNSTHASFTATDLATFQHDMANAPADSKAHPIYTDIKVSSVTIEPADPNTAIVKLSANMLNSISSPPSAAATSSATAADTPRDETLTVVKSSTGKWLVKWN
jgi:DNA-directed RNA polymerase subunit RPC12/RpoP